MAPNMVLVELLSSITSIKARIDELLMILNDNKKNRYFPKFCIEERIKALSKTRNRLVSVLYKLSEDNNLRIDYCNIKELAHDRTQRESI